MNRCASLVLATLLVCAPARGAAEVASTIQAAWQAAADALQTGPRTIVLGDQAAIELPDGYGFVPKEQATRLMDAWGNHTDQRFRGLLLPLADVRGGDPSSRVGGRCSGRRGAVGEPNDEPTINYNTYVLGREVYVSLNLITTSSSIDLHKASAKALLAAVSFNEGKRYGHFDSSTDKVAAFGLAALVGGVAAKKLGLIAIAGAFFVKFAKVIILDLAALVALLARVLRRDRS